MATREEAEIERLRNKVNALRMAVNLANAWTEPGLSGLPDEERLGRVHELTSKVLEAEREEATFRMMVDLPT